MNPLYSILLCNYQLSEYADRIDDWLKQGIKVFWFGTKEDVTDLNSRFSLFRSAFLLLTYEVEFSDQITIVDGNDVEEAVTGILENQCPMFNAAQYRVEHCQLGENIVVQASAGTGKTAVMIDRIMFLLHTVPDLQLSEIYMITFTNDAAQQMSNRLQDVLTARYTLTKNKRYLRWVEEQSQMHISTIHSFAFYMLKQLGIGEGFTKGLSIRSFEYEKKELIKDALDNRVDENKNILRQLGLPFYRANSIINDYWGKFAQLGVSHEELQKMDWGQAVDDNSGRFHRVITGIVSELDEQFLELKREEEAVSINDIMRDLQAVLENGDIPYTDLSMKYLFIDEFQDSDLSQIKVACLLGKMFGPDLFVVGDIKQSIYRFRGATDKAFEIFDMDLKEMGLKPPRNFLLVNNYRTAAGVLHQMDKYFLSWAKEGYLKYDREVIPFNTGEGKMKMIPSADNKGVDPQQVADIVSSELDILKEKVESSDRQPNEKDRVVVLCRSNYEVGEVAKWLRKEKIPVSVRQDGEFYKSETVRDFYMMVTSFMYCDEPKHIFNYLLTPYAGEIDPLDINKMEMLGGDYRNLTGYLDHFLDQTSWKEYHKQLRLRPVMAVFKDMLDDTPLIDNYIALNKRRRLSNEWTEERIIADTRTQAQQYQANLEKLMEILQHNLKGDKVSLYDIYNFLRLNIATNRSESEAEIQSRDDYGSVLCMTVHKSKGLEFNTIVIPFTNENFEGELQTELLVDPVNRKVGWCYTGDKERVSRRYKYDPMKNSYYDSILADEIRSGVLEGVRVLYVGMTRAIDTLICIVGEGKKPMTWANLIEEVGVDYE